LRHNNAHIHVLQCTEKAISCFWARQGSAGVVVEKHITRHGDWPLSDGSLQRALVEFSETNNLTNARVVTILPRHCATVRILELPSHDAEEVAGMVELSADEIVPFSADEIVVSSCIIKKLPNEHSQVLATVVHQDVLEEHLSLFQAAGIAPEHIYLSTACMLAALEYPTVNSDGITAYGHASGFSFELLALDAGALLHTRGFESGTQDVSQVTDALRSLEREHPKSQGSTVYLSNGDKPGSLLVDEIRQASDLNVSEATMGLRGVKKGVEALNGIPLLEIGAVLLTQGDSPYVVDLLPRSVRDDRVRNTTKRAVVQNVAMLVLTLMLIGAVFGQAVYQRNTYLTDLKNRAEILQPEAELVALKRRHLQRLQEQVTRADTAYEHIGRIASQAPNSGITLSLFDYKYDNGIILQGRAENTDKFSNLIDQLRTVGKSVYPQFAAAHELYRTTKRERDQDIWEYAISIQFPKELEVKNE
jgi:hypothetical protein